MRIKGSNKPRNPNPANPFRQEEKPKKLVYFIGLHRTLAFYNPWGSIDDIGEPVPDMKKRVLSWIKEGVTIKIFTARACDQKAIKYIRKWLIINGFPADLAITNILSDDYDMIFDSKSREVIFNTGIIVSRMGEFKN